jgi:hypothetical protein
MLQNPYITYRNDLKEQRYFSHIFFFILASSTYISYTQSSTSFSSLSRICASFLQLLSPFPCLPLSPSLYFCFLFPISFSSIDFSSTYSSSPPSSSFPSWPFSSPASFLLFHHFYFLRFLFSFFSFCSSCFISTVFSFFLPWLAQNFAFRCWGGKENLPNGLGDPGQTWTHVCVCFLAFK